MFSSSQRELSRFKLKNMNATGYVEAVTNANDIDKAAARRILVESFIAEYSAQKMEPAEIDKSLTSWRGKEHSVQKYYETYFDTEFKKFSEGKFEFWVTAYVGARLVGWATFERDKDGSVYMDLLIVDPTYQRNGIGEQLVKSLLNLNIIPDLSAVHLDLRKKNVGGRKFYEEKLGFVDDPSYQRNDNFVDLSLLTPLTWKNPRALVNKLGGGQVRIMSLGEIVTPDIMKAIHAFTALIAKKLQAANPAEIGKAIGQVLTKNMNMINDFKLGAVNEADFTNHMINELKKATTVELTIDEFDQAWNAMHPKLDKFVALLNLAIEYNNARNQRVIFISFTNPKDIRHLVGELHKSDISYKVVEDQLVEIAGIQLFTTYHSKLNKAKLIETTIKTLCTQSPTQSALANSMSRVFSSDRASEKAPSDIKYIRCVNDINDPILKEDLDQTNQGVEKAAAQFFVDTILWVKNEKSLSEVLCSSQNELKKIAVVKL